MSASLQQPRPAVLISLSLSLVDLFPFLFAGWVGLAGWFGSDPFDAIQPAGLGTMAIGMTVIYAERASRWSGCKVATRAILRRYVRTVVWIPIVLAVPCVVLDVLAYGSNCFEHGCTTDLRVMLTVSLVLCAIGVVLLLGNWRYLREPVEATSLASSST